MNHTRGGVNLEFLLILRIGQSRHETNAGNAAVGSNITVNASGSAQGCVGRFAVYNNLFAAFIDHEVARGRPFQCGVVQFAKPVE